MSAPDDIRHAEESRCAACKVALLETWSRSATEGGSSGKGQWIAGALMVLVTRPLSAVALPVAGLRRRVRWARPELVLKLDSRSLFVFQLEGT